MGHTCRCAVQQPMVPVHQEAAEEGEAGEGRDAADGC